MFEDARERLQQKRNAECLAAYRNEAPSGSPTTARGYYLKALILEYDVEGSGSNYLEAIDCYRMASHLTHNSDEFYLLCIARVMMKQGPEEHAAALAYIDLASAARHTPEVELAYATFYEDGREVDLAKARACFRRAAFAGRFAGFWGVSRILRKQGNWLPALAVDCLRILTGPFLRLLIGRRVTSSFNGYWR